MNSGKRNSGNAELIAVTGLAVVIGVSVVAVQLGGTKGLKESVQKLNRLEGFYTSEIAAWNSYVTSQNPQNTARNGTLDLNNDYTKELCTGPGCPTLRGPNRGQNPDQRREYKDGEPVSMKQLVQDKRVGDHTPIIRRFTAGSVNFMASEARDKFCGTADYSPNTIGVKTCLARPNSPGCTAADTITFETIPNGTPADMMLVSSQFKASHGVTFCIDRNGDFDCDDSGEGFAAIVKTGWTGGRARAFPCDTCAQVQLQDTAKPDQGVGDFFLSNNTVGDAFSRHTEGIIVKYDTSVAEASGYILDLDDDGATVQARGQSGNVLETKTLSPQGFPKGDGEASFFSFRRPTADIYSLYIETIGDRVGLGFDNFSPSKVCNTPQPTPPPRRVPTNTVGVVFEDSVANGFDADQWWDWDYRDIRACVMGSFEVDPASHRIYSTSAVPQNLQIISEMRLDIGCRHRFFVEVYNSAGTKTGESRGYDARGGRFLDTTNITVQQGDEVVLSWELISGNECRFRGRDYSTRMSAVRPQTGGRPSQTLPPPSFFYGWCGDFGPGLTPYGCQGTHDFNSQTEIRNHIDYEPDLPPLSTSGIIDWIGADQITREKVCELTGHPVVRSYTTTSNGSTTNRRTVTYNPTTHTWDKVDAAVNNTLLQRISCGCP